VAVDIEPPVRKLVSALNQYAAVHTIGSCGGHADPGRDQCGEGEFYVEFVVEHSLAAWRSLERIAFAVASEPNVTIRAFCSGDDPVCLAFALRGTNPIGADAVAEALEQERERSGRWDPQRNTLEEAFPVI
jgi:hypothetical protein